MIPLSIAPMMDRTDRHHRYIMRTLSPDVLLYTEMVNMGAIVHGDRERHLGFSPQEHPVVLQIGGDDPKKLAEAARIVQDYGYDEINLNVGCPSSRVSAGNFGAVLMKDPQRVADAVSAMRAVVSIPVTVKHRIGVDDIDTYDHMLNFVDVVAQSGCTQFTVHARKAWLKGLSPKENRNIPPLRHHEVYRLKAERPHLSIETNGGIKTTAETLEHLQHVDAVMIGRAAVDTPWVFHELQQAVFQRPSPVSTREELVHALIPYVEEQNAQGVPTHRVTRHLLQLFAGEPGTRRWKQVLTEGSRRPGKELLLEALEAQRSSATRHHRSIA